MIQLSESAPVLGYQRDESSTCSQRSFPEHEFAWPNQMPHLIPLDQIMHRKSQRQRRRSRVRREQRRLETTKKERTLASIDEHSRRLEIRRLRKETLERARFWLKVVALVVPVAWNLSHRFLALRNDRSAREARRVEVRARESAADVIQRVVRNRLVYKHREDILDFWNRSTHFAGKMKERRWLAALHIRCWRRRHAVLKIKTFLRETHSNRGAQAVGHFILKVRKIQRGGCRFLAARRQRRRILGNMWDDVDSKLSRALSSKKEILFEPMEVVPRRKGEVARLSQRIPEQVNSDITRMAKLQESTDKLVESSGLVPSKKKLLRCRKRRKSCVPSNQRIARIEAIFVDILRRSEENEVEKNEESSSFTGAASSIAMTAGSMQPRTYSSKEAYSILSLTSCKGMVKPVRDLYQKPSTSTPSNYVLPFFTAYRPNKLRDVVARAWLDAYNETHSPVSLDTMQSLLLKADEEEKDQPTTLKTTKRKRHPRRIPRGPKEAQQSRKRLPGLSDPLADHARHAKGTSGQKSRAKPEKQKTRTEFPSI